LLEYSLSRLSVYKSPTSYVQGRGDHNQANLGPHHNINLLGLARRCSVHRSIGGSTHIHQVQGTCIRFCIPSDFMDSARPIVVESEFKTTTLFIPKKCRHWFSCHKFNRPICRDYMQYLYLQINLIKKIDSNMYLTILILCLKY
jgi:hypothetical protein